MKPLKLKSIIIIIFLSAMLLNSACTKEDPHPFINTEWQIISAKFHADSILEYPPLKDGSYILGFDKKKRFYLSLGHSGCAGKVKFIQDNKVEFSEKWCTLIAVHSEFAANIMNNIIHTNTYKLYEYNKSILKLSSEKGIIINLEKK